MVLWIVGAGGVGREALDACLAGGIHVTGFLDDGRAGQVVRGLDVLGVTDVDAHGEYFIGISDPVARARLSAQLDARGLNPREISHPRALKAPDTTAGPGLLLLAGAYVSSSVTIGKHCQVHYNATVGHDAALGDFVTVCPGANVSGSVHLADGVTVGSNAVVLQGRSIGRGAFIGAGAVVTRDVPANDVVVGVPARSLHRRHEVGVESESS